MSESLIKVGIIDRPLERGLTTMIRFALAPAVIDGFISFVLHWLLMATFDLKETSVSHTLSMVIRYSDPGGK